MLNGVILTLVRQTLVKGARDENMKQKYVGKPSPKAYDRSREDREREMERERDGKGQELL